MCLRLLYLAPDRERVFNAVVVVYKLACRPFASAKSRAWSAWLLIGYPLVARRSSLVAMMMYRGLRIGGVASASTRLCSSSPPVHKQRCLLVEHAFRPDTLVGRSIPIPKRNSLATAYF